MTRDVGTKDNLNGLFNTRGSKRRDRLGVGVAEWDKNRPWYYRNRLASYLEPDQTLPDKFVTDYGDGKGKICLEQRYQMQRNGKKALAMRSIESLPEHVKSRRLDQRRDWNKASRPVSNVLEQFFPSFQFSYSTPLPQAYRRGSVDLFVSEQGEGQNSRRLVRVVDMARSHSIWLDPIDAPKELYKYRLRISRIVNWSYKLGYVPVMMTLTTYHRWHHLDGLLEVLRESWKDLLSNYSGRQRVADVGLRGWIRRTEITINDGDDNGSDDGGNVSCLNCTDYKKINSSTDSKGDKGSNDNGYQLSDTGWHPHYHAILIVPEDKLQRLSDVEDEWRVAWVKAVCKHHKKVFGEEIDETYLPAFRSHGLMFSRVYDGDMKAYGSLRHVDDSSYLAKIMGYDPVEVYGGDKEMTSSTIKHSKTPFDLIRDSSLPAGNVDLWVEYAFATKGVPAIKFSKGLEDTVNVYFADHPEQDTSSYKVCPVESVVASLNNDVYQLLYRNFKLNEMKQAAAKGYDSLCLWLTETFVELGVSQFANLSFAIPRAPT